MVQRPFRFGVIVRGVSDAVEWAAQVRRAEGLGYSVISLPDHLGFPLSPIPALMAAAAASTSIRLGTMVLNNDLRHPALLAADIATLDILSGGRVELGLGAGWLRTDYQPAGFDYAAGSVRVQRLAESVAVLKGLFADTALSFAGRHYRIDDMQGQPKPLQRPHPPLLIGGGRRQILSLAAREADIVSIHVDLSAADHFSASHPETLHDITTDAILERLGWIRAAAGARFDSLELQMVLFDVVVDPEINHTSAPASPHIVRGSVEQIADMLQARRERYGISYFSVRELHRDVFAPVVALLAGR